MKAQWRWLGGVWGGWGLGKVGVGGRAVVMIQDGAELIQAWGCLSRGWPVEVTQLTSHLTD